DDVLCLHLRLHASGHRHRSGRRGAPRARHRGGIRHGRRHPGRDLFDSFFLRAHAKAGRASEQARAQAAGCAMTHTLRRCAAMITAMGLMAAAGCALGPDYRRPDIRTPAAYRFEQNPTAGSFADNGWWQVYQDPVLRSLIREGLAGNLDVRIAAARVDQARAALGSARLQQLPAVSIDAGATRQRTSTYELPPGVPPVSNAFSVEGSVSYEIDFWGRYRRASEAARAQLLQSAYAKQDVAAGLVAGVATAYFTLKSLDEQLEITRRTVGTRQKFVDLTQAQHDRGTVSELDVATAQAQLAIAKATLPDLMR